MTRFCLAAGVVVGTLSLGLTSLHAEVPDPVGREPPCNSWCERWMRLGQGEGPASPSDTVEASVPGADAASIEVSNLPPPPVPPSAVRDPARTTERAAHRKLVATEAKPALRPVPLPPRRIRVDQVTARATPPRPVPSPFGALPPSDRVGQVIAALPLPPAILHEKTIPSPAPAPTQPEPAMPDRSTGAALPAGIPSSSAEPAADAQPAPAVAPAPLVQAAWPPPIDVIGYLLTMGTVNKRVASSVGSSAP